MDASHFVTQKKFNAAMVQANSAIGQEWHAKILPRRFKKGSQVDNKPRSTKYREWKKKRWASRRPLKNGQYIEGSGETDNVLTGDFRDLMTQSSVIRAYPTRVSVQTTAPRYISMRVWKANQPKKLEEVQATTAAERDHLARIADPIIERAAAGW
jgi:hypothetical protein